MLLSPVKKFFFVNTNVKNNLAGPKAEKFESFKAQTTDAR